ncbi:MAG: hypothetical protein OXF77_03315 [Thaumarchaeota archaeon]|nr:hypothetical protein [Nitrososphaerota archaeon]
MKQFSKFGIILGIIIAILLVVVINNNKTLETDVSLVSGPFSINNSKYNIGENIFIVVKSLQPNETGRMLIISSNNEIYSNIEFNGSNKSGFNKYFRPTLPNNLVDVCSIDVVGKWKIMLQGVRYQNIYMKIIDNTSGSEINKYKKIC